MVAVAQVVILYVSKDWWVCLLGNRFSFQLF